MAVSTATPKGQVVIPAERRRKYEIEAGTKMSVDDGEGCIVVRPLHRARASESFGVLKRFAGRSTIKALKRDRQREAQRQASGCTTCPTGRICPNLLDVSVVTGDPEFRRLQPQTKVLCTTDTQSSGT